MDRGHQPRSRSPHGRTYDGYYAREDYRQRSPGEHRPDQIAECQSL